MRTATTSLAARVVRGTTLCLLLASSPWTLAAKAKAPARKSLCANAAGIFVGLATDEDAYVSVAGEATEGDPDGGGEGYPSQKWELTADSPAGRGEAPAGPQHSYDRRFLQVLPDVGRSYPGRGRHLQKASQLLEPDSATTNSAAESNSPFVSFLLEVEKGREGIHTLFLRWTGGDTVGGGDSLYVVLYKRSKKRSTSSTNRNENIELVHGQQTVKPSVVPIDAGMSKYAGCCYDPVTHACPCYATKPESNSTCPDNYFIDRSRAANFGVQCLVGGGAYTIIPSPEWYLYAGQEQGDVMDFDSEPWDVTCEADGSNTLDSGHDFPSWNLEKGSYELRIYAREDGTALDGIYVAGPGGRAPAVAKRYARGDSTLCPERSAKQAVASWALASSGVLLLLGLVAAWVSSSPGGREALGAVLRKPAQAVRYVYVESA